MKLQDNFKAYVDGEVSPGMRLLVRDHLKEHPEDQKVVDEFGLLSKSIREYLVQPEPVGMESTLAALEAAKPKARTAKRFRQQLAWAGAAMASVMLIGLVFGRNGSVFGLNPIDRFGLDVQGGNQLRAPIVPPSANQGVSIRAGNPAPSASSTSTPGWSGLPPAKAEMRGQGRKTENGSGMSLGGVATTDQSNYADFPYDVEPVPKVSSPSTGTILHQPMIQRDASLTLRVGDVADAQHATEQLTAGLGGYVSQSSRAESMDTNSTATMSLRIPGPHFEDALKFIHKLGKVVSESSSGLDVTSQAVDMAARLKVLKTEESDYLLLLGRARSTGQIIEIKDKLTDIQEEIESITSQQATLKDQVQYATIDLTLSDRDPKKIPVHQKDTWLLDTWTSALNGLESIAKVAAQLFIFALVLLPIWLPLSLLGAWAYRKLRW
jgi:hypothetical protein